jgi:hypothetical protein
MENKELRSFYGEKGTYKQQDLEPPYEIPTWNGSGPGDFFFSRKYEVQNPLDFIPIG